MSEEPKIHVLLGGKKDDSTETLLKKAAAEFDAWQRIYGFEAKRKKAMFDHLIGAGFTEQQALAIIK